MVPEDSLKILIVAECSGKYHVIQNFVSAKSKATQLGINSLARKDQGKK